MMVTSVVLRQLRQLPIKHEKGTAIDRGVFLIEWSALLCIRNFLAAFLNMSVLDLYVELSFNGCTYNAPDEGSRAKLM